MNQATILPWGGSAPMATVLRSGQVLWDESPCAVGSPNSKPFTVEKRFCCRPESSAEVPVENCGAVEEQKQTKHINCT